MGSREKKRIVYFDVMNILACLAVIALHHNGYVHSFENTMAWKQSLIIECLFYWAVPVFLMISGANLLGFHEKYNLKDYFRKRICRTVIPWLFWSCIIMIWKLYTNQISPEVSGIKGLVKLVIGNEVESVYWFFTTLFACYLIIPILTYLIARKEVLWYIVGVLFVTSSVLPIVERWTGFEQNIIKNAGEPLIIYVILGYLLNNMVLNKKQRVIIYVLGIGSFLFRYVYTYIFSIQNNVTDVSIKGYSTFHAVFLSVAVFVFLKQVSWEKILSDKILGLLPQISSYSFGVYLIHKLVMYYEMQWFGLENSRFAWRILCIPVTYCVSVCIIYGLKKIPILKKIIC